MIFPVNGRDLVTGIPKQVMVSYQEAAEAPIKYFKIEEAIPQSAGNNAARTGFRYLSPGFYITGGWHCLVRGLDKRLNAKIKLPVPTTALKSVVRGTGIALKITTGIRS